MLLALLFVISKIDLDVVYDAAVKKIISEEGWIVALHTSNWDFQYKAIIESHWE